jgi:hypothetical protein
LRILESRERNSVALKVGAETVHLAIDSDENQGWLKFIRHMLSLETVPSRLVYKLEDAPWSYLFIRKINDEIAIKHMVFDSETKAVLEWDDFFEMGKVTEYKEAEVPKLTPPLFSDKRVQLAAVCVVAVIALVSVYKFILHRPHPPAEAVVQHVEPDLSNVEKSRLRAVGSRRLLERITGVISDVRKNEYMRISAMSTQKSEAPNMVTYILTVQKEYQYPDDGTKAKSKGVWDKTDTETVSVGREDIRNNSGSGDFSDCLERMLVAGFNVAGRKSPCASVTYEGEAAKVIAIYGSVTGCPVSVDALTIADGKGKLDATICDESPHSEGKKVIACSN